MLPFEGPNTFGNYNITWMLNGNPISGAPNKPEYTAPGPSTYNAQLSLKLNLYLQQTHPKMYLFILQL
ncbi:hypothetical protein [Lacihabitans lacunae]|uniref:Uncharacterized protein n=1 Tax=Lacihabitans lacunae TaxID=1028214 RepID=A0ABV7Z033_9BACT